MTGALAVPSARRLRAAVRRSRRRHGESAAADLYVFLLFALVYGAGADRLLARYATRHGGLLGDAGRVRWWLAVAAALALAGLAWRGARLLGPLLAAPAEQAWCLSTPVDRAGWLLNPLLLRVCGGAAAGAALGVACGALAGAAALGWLAAVGAGAGAALIAAAALLQSRRLRRIHPLEWVPAGAGFAGAATVLGLHAGTVRLPEPTLPPVPVAAAALALAGAVTVAAVLGLPRVDRAAVAGGAQVADAATAAALFLDPALLFGVLEARRWRGAGRVRHQPLGPGWARLPGPRWWLLLAADARRLARRPGGLAVWAALLVLPYAVAVLAPGLAGAARLVAAYFATSRLAAGLRLVHASPALRRALGGADRDLLAVHAVSPALGLAAWWLLSGGVHMPPGYPGQLLFPAGVLAAVYRGATRPPRNYEGGAFDTPFGGIPVGLLRQLVRGVDVLAVLVLAQLLFQ
jgi:hypothetical protein